MNAADIAVFRKGLQNWALEPALVATVVDLRWWPVNNLRGGEVVCVATPRPTLYVWCPTADDDDNGRGAIAPVGFTSGNAGRWLMLARRVLVGSVTYDPPSLVPRAGATTTFTVTGAEMGDLVLVSFSLDLLSIIVTGYVDAPDTVGVRFENPSAGATIDLGSGTLSAMVFKKP